LLIGQAEVCDTLVRWDAQGRTDVAYQPGKFKPSVASAANISDPVSFPRVEKLLDQFEAHFFSATEKQIQDSQMAITRGGVDICPQTGIALSALFQAQEAGLVKDHQRSAVISTATGLKFAESACEYHTQEPAGRYTNYYKVASGSKQAVEEILENW